MADHRKPTSDEEEKYFQREDREARQRLLQQRQLAAIRQQEKQDIARALNTNEEIADEALALGFDADTARVLPLVPIIQVAWADGKVSTAEHDKVLELAAEYGLEAGTAAHDFLLLLLNEQPTNTFFERVNTLMMRLVAANPDDWINRNIVDLCVAVAQASGGLFGLGNRISKEEQALLERFAVAFSVDKSQAPL